MKPNKSTISPYPLGQKTFTVAKNSFIAYWTILTIKFLLYISGLGDKTDMIILSRLLMWTGLVTIVSVMVNNFAQKRSPSKPPN